MATDTAVRPWVAADRDRLRIWRAAGVTIAECARRLGRTWASVQRASHRFGFSPRMPAPPADLAARLRAGETRREIAGTCGVHPNTVRNWRRQVTAVTDAEIAALHSTHVRRGCQALASCREASPP